MLTLEPKTKVRFQAGAGRQAGRHCFEKKEARKHVLFFVFFLFVVVTAAAGGALGYF